MATSERLTIGIDIGGTNLRAAVVDPTGRIIDVEQLPTPSSVGALDTAIGHVVAALRTRHEVVAVGLAVAAFITADQTSVRFAPHLPWRDIEIRDRMTRVLGLPVVLEHDANAAAWGEQILGPGREADTWAFFAVGTGIGGALVTDRKLYRGEFGTAPEFGHLTVVQGGRTCPCGKRGCLERYCSGSALELTAREFIATGRHPRSALAEHYHSAPEGITGRTVVRLARDGDPLALKVIEDFACWMGRGLAVVQEILDPGLIVVGGGVSRDADLFLDHAVAEMAENVVGAGHRPLARVETGVLGADAGMIGVALLAGTANP
ncbi:ROK family protein [Corynebacterium terpenotabidum]|uniref:Glucose kinase n=1 Tax=Corynebacterium terpenotabidum Y-11 TaxID=1200352 RepID=S4XFX8_9CORY|nr:ROK family protein [Corynebacterium terpenotabidum]AGP30560.1 glucose kinase [Corynebacterium terpenotabidum Y-11]